MTTSMRSVAIGAAVTLLAVTGCGDDASSATGTEAQPEPSSAAPPTAPASTTETTVADPSDTESPPASIPLTDSFRGVTSTSIHLGVLSSDIAEIRERGFSKANFGDPELIAAALFDSLNESGGILGREVVLDFTLYSVLDPADVDAKCVKLTEDNQNFAVLGAPSGAVVASSVTCFTGLHETIVVGGTHTDELLEQSVAPWISDAMSANRFYGSSIDIFAQEGLLDSGSIAVLAAHTDRQTIEELVVPTLAGHGIEPVEVLYITTRADEVAIDAEVGLIAQKLLTSDIDTVVLFGGLPLTFGQLDAAGWSGERLVVDPTGSVSRSGDVTPDPSILDGLVATIGLFGDEFGETPSASECIDTFEAAHPEIEVMPISEVPEGEPDWVTGIVRMCSLLQVFVEVAEAAGPDLTNESFGDAVLGLTDSFATAMSPFNTFGPGKLDSADGLRLAEFDSTLGETGELVAITPVVDISKTG